VNKYRTVVTFGDYFEDFLREQGPGVQAKILQVLRIIEMIERVPKTYLRRIENTDGLYEILVVFGGNIFRVLCFFDADRLIVLLSGFQKKTQRTPRNEIERAARMRNEYYREKQKTKGNRA